MHTMPGGEPENLTETGTREGRARRRQDIVQHSPTASLLLLQRAGLRQGHRSYQKAAGEYFVRSDCAAHTQSRLRATEHQEGEEDGDEVKQVRDGNDEGPSHDGQTRLELVELAGRPSLRTGRRLGCEG